MVPTYNLQLASFADSPTSFVLVYVCWLFLHRVCAESLGVLIKSNERYTTSIALQHNLKAKLNKHEFPWHDIWQNRR